MHQRGFTLIESLFALSVTLMIIINLPAVLKTVPLSTTASQEDLSIGVKQLSDYLMSSEVIDLGDTLTYQNNKKKTFTIKLDHHRLVKTPGFEILIDEIDDVCFEKENDYLLMHVTRDQKEATYVISDLYRGEAHAKTQ